MTVHVFGAVLSPSCANVASNFGFFNACKVKVCSCLSFNLHTMSMLQEVCNIATKYWSTRV